MLLTTMDQLPQGKYEITEIIGLVSAEVVFGINIGKDFLAGITNVIGGRSTSYEEEIQRTKADAIRELESRAADMGADAVIAIRFSIATFGSSNGMVSIIADGTAVKLAS